MKTPWKMLADLVSRKSTPKLQHDSSPNDGVKIGHQAQTDEAPTIAAHVTIENRTPAWVASSAHASDTHDDVEQADPSSTDAATDGAVPDETPPPLIRVAEAPDAATATKEPAAGSAVAKRKKRGDTPAEQKPAAPAVDVPSQTLLRPKTVFDEWTTLDAEISDIRRRLAEKLSLQNAQLREMLDRFDKQ